jgi:hypothetical protein
MNANSQNWKPITEAQIWDDLNSCVDALSPSEKKLFDSARIEPEKWALHPWGDEGGGFWVVALIGRNVLWFNDIENGYNLSRYSDYRRIDEYWCNQDSLSDAIRRLAALTSI